MPFLSLSPSSYINFSVLLGGGKGCLRYRAIFKKKSIIDIYIVHTYEINVVVIQIQVYKYTLENQTIVGHYIAY